METYTKESKEPLKASGTWSDLILGLFEDRVGDPLWRSYIFFFIIYNWKAVAALIFGKVDEPYKRIELVLNYLQYNEFKFPYLGYIFGCIFSYQYHYILVPLLYSLIFIFIYLKYLKPKIVDIYARHNGLSIESIKNEIKEYNNKINQLNNDHQKLESTYIDYHKAMIEYLRYLGKRYESDYMIVIKEKIGYTKLEKDQIIDYSNHQWKVIHIFNDAFLNQEKAIIEPLNDKTTKKHL